MSRDPLLRARNLSRRVYDGAEQLSILKEINLEIVAGERVALLGPSGSGKSTLLHILGALDPEYEGSVELAGHKLESMRDNQLAQFRNQTAGFVFQSFNLLGHLSVLENVLLPARFSKTSANGGRATTLLEGVGLADKAHRMPHTLSGGERQRVAIARAFYAKPKLVLCDEPSGNLDRETGAEILALFDTLMSEGTTLLIATHDESIARTASRTLQLRSGELV